jgi:ferredoxin-NADP reductase/DMSO/TMAO reductase YedYZ heme-binding membrane subunit
MADWLINAGRITGMLAGYLIAVLLVLMARVPALDRVLGSDRLTRWHATGGRYVVGLVVAHAGLILWGYAAAAHASPVAEGQELLASYPDVLMATVAGGLLVGVGISSARAARRRLRYETWHALHLYTYLAIALSFSHTFATGAEFMGSAPARWAWSAMYLAAAGLVIWYRFASPVRAAIRHRLVVSAVVPEGRNVVSVYFAGRRLQDLGARAGQFYRWRFLTRDLWGAANPYSLSADPQREGLRITVQIVGGHSAALARLKPGTRVLAEGPSGGLTAARRRRRKALLIGGGVGVTPLRAMLAAMPAEPGDLTFLLRASTPHDVVLHEELERLAAYRGARLHYLIGRRAKGYDPFRPEALRQLVPDIAAHEVYLCGPPGMADAATAGLRAVGVPRRHIHTESFEF